MQDWGGSAALRCVRVSLASFYLLRGPGDRRVGANRLHTLGSGRHSTSSIGFCALRLGGACAEFAVCRGITWPHSRMLSILSVGLLHSSPPYSNTWWSVLQRLGARANDEHLYQNAKLTFRLHFTRIKQTSSRSETGIPQ